MSSPRVEKVAAISVFENARLRECGRNDAEKQHVELSKPSVFEDDFTMRPSGKGGPETQCGSYPAEAPRTFAVSKSLRSEECPPFRDDGIQPSIMSGGVARRDHAMITELIVAGRAQDVLDVVNHAHVNPEDLSCYATSIRHLSECASDGCSINRKTNPRVRTEFEDEIVRRVGQMQITPTDPFVYTSVGSGKLFADLVLLTKIVHAVPLSELHINVIDSAYASDAEHLRAVQDLAAWYEADPHRNVKITVYSDINAYEHACRVDPGAKAHVLVDIDLRDSCSTDFEPILTHLRGAALRDAGVYGSLSAEGEVLLT